MSTGAGTIDDIGDHCGAGTGCGACVAEIEDKLARAGRGCSRDRTGECPRLRAPDSSGK